MADNMFSQSPMSSYYGFGINPAYTTPAYMSNFRPAYASDTDPFNPYSQNRSYMEALRNQYMFNPIGTYASDPAEDERANNWSLNTMHSDAFVNGVTKVGIPLAAWYGANKFFGMKVASRSPTSGLWDRSAAYAGAIYRGQGMKAAAAAWGATAAQQSLGAAAGSVLGRGAGQIAGGFIGGAGRLMGLGGALGGAEAILGGAGAVAGGLIGSIAAPLAVGAGVAKAANYYLAEPYIGLRRGEDAMLANTANQFVGGSAGPNMGSFGISARHANRLSQAFMQDNIRDMGFQPGDYAAMADYGMQAGIFNDIGNLNVDDMKKRVSGMADSVKMIMAVANTTSVKEAIQYMSRLKAAGVSNPGAVTRVMSEMGMAAGISGSSAEQIMNTVGNQGQMIAQRLGMLPVMGQRQAANIYAGFANAYKAGTLNQADAAALGGVEGATQYAMEGAGRIFSMPYFKAAINSGAELGSGNMLNVAAAYGTRRAGNPLQSFGDDIINSGVRTTEYLNKHSSMETVMNFLYDQTANIPSARGKDGKVDIRAALGWAVTNGYLSEEEARTYALQFKAGKDPESQRRLEAASRGTADKQMNQWMSQQGYDTLSGVPILGNTIQKFRQLNRDVLEESSGVSGAFTRMRAGMSDSWDSFQASVMGRKNPNQQAAATWSMENGQQVRTELDIGSYMSYMGNETRMTGNDGILKSLANDVLNADPESELGKMAKKLYAGIGKNQDNRADLDAYYRLKKGDVGAAQGMTRSQYMDQGNRALQTARVKETKVTAMDLNPKVSDDFVKSFGSTSEESWWSQFDLFGLGPTSMGRDVSAFKDGDGARVFNAAIGSMSRTGKADLRDLYEAGGGENSYFSGDFGKLLAKYKQDPSSLTAEERSRVEEFMAMQKMSGMDKSTTDKIEQGILALGRGDNQNAGILFGEEGDKYRENIAKNVGKTIEGMDVSTIRKGMKFGMQKNGRTGNDIDAIDSLSDTSLMNGGVRALAEKIQKGAEISTAANQSASQNRDEMGRLSEKFGGEEFVKSFGDVADNIGKATDGLSGSADALTKAAAELSKAAKAGGNDPKLTQAIENLNRILTKPGLGNVKPNF
jgi:hypothetical protein